MVSHPAVVRSRPTAHHQPAVRSRLAVVSNWDERLPGVLVSFHDPNFGVNFEATMGALESVPPASIHRLRPEAIIRKANPIASVPAAHADT